MSARADRLKERVEEMLKLQAECQSEATMLRKIAEDLMVKANKLDETASYHDRQIADWHAMIRDEEAKQ